MRRPAFWVVIAAAIAVSVFLGYRGVQWSLYDSWERTCLRNPVNHAARFAFAEAQFEDGSTVRLQYCIDERDNYVNHRELP